MRVKKWSGVLSTMLLMVLIVTACSKENKQTGQSKELEGKKLFVYCGAGMTKPFTEIAESFQGNTGAVVEVTFGNAAQIISQITASEEGDLFIAGAEGELDSIRDDYIADVKNLVKHIPVIAVQTGNPKNISGIMDLGKEGITVVLGDSDATPIGKIADKALTDAGIYEQVEVAARTATAPEISTALSLGQCDAAIVWKENAGIEGVEVVSTTDLDKYVKIVPAASLKCSKNAGVLEEFLLYLESDEAIKIWENYGYEVVE
ncbi:molybdate ABC transporter substrate-binding protein [Anaeromicropila populeti]|uniref:Molybdate transport system substrate-binding protein n=1 Tax=Anaeromicropila populeti TaxID=37658 RepID=A0A1I6JAR7_9FIRM|nr:molybdate ABC transporter substrate-binding protein [Anaeromicropila populeti]SFR76034.1 molybdate transport system substrate-binding protein [Anaeromicropila populeti]